MAEHNLFHGHTFYETPPWLTPDDQDAPSLVICPADCGRCAHGEEAHKEGKNCKETKHADGTTCPACISEEDKG